VQIAADAPVPADAKKPSGTSVQIPKFASARGEF